MLPEVVVYATRIDAEASTLPAIAHIADGGAVAASGARDLPDLVSRVGGVQVRTVNANPLQAQVAIRGFGENSFGRVKILVDGVEINSADMDPPHLAGVPLDGVGRVEVMAGPSPVLYGDGAVAGVISVDSDDKTYDSVTRLTVKGGSYGTFGAGVATRGGSETNGVRYSAAYDWNRSDGWRDRTGYDMHAASGTIGKDFSNGSSVALRTRYSNALYEMPGALTLSQWRHDRRQAKYWRDSCRIWDYDVGAALKALIADDQWFRCDIGFFHKHRTSRWGDYGYENDCDLYTYRFLPRYVNESEVFGHDSALTIGVDARYEFYGVRDRSGYGEPHDHFERLRTAPYVHESFGLTEELTLVAGARGECVANRWAHGGSLSDNDSCDTLGDFELGAVYRPWNFLKAYAKGTRFHRSAFCDELNYTRNGKFLEPETGSSLDIGAECAIGREASVDVVAYWTVIDDEIFYDPHAKESAPGVWGGYNCNSDGRTERLGVDAGCAWRRKGTAEASLRGAFADARFRDGPYGGENIPLVPAVRARAEAGVWIVEDLEAKAGVRYEARQVLAGDYDNDHDRLPSHTLFDAGLVYEPHWAKGWKASVTVDNLLDKSYCDYAGWSDYSGAYYYPACGRTFIVTVSYAF